MHVAFFNNNRQNLTYKFFNYWCIGLLNIFNFKSPMALLKSTSANLPSDAIILSEEEALSYEKKILKDWKKKSDVWAFHYGKFFLAAGTTLTSWYINSYYRTKFKLFSYGKVSSYLATVAMPTVSVIIFHSEFVLPGVILQRDCPICLEIRGSAYQTFSGCILPVILSPLATMSLALRYGTTDIPYITSEPLKAFNFYKSKTKPIVNILFAIFVGQALLGGLVTHLEARSVHKVNRKLLELEKNLESSKN